MTMENARPTMKGSGLGIVFRVKSRSYDSAIGWINAIFGYLKKKVKKRPNFPFLSGDRVNTDRSENLNT